MIEKFIMNGCKKGDLAIRVDHISGVLTFDSDAELGKLVDELELNGLVNLGQLLEQTGENDLLQRHNV
jgi:hypothetical protein